MNGLHQEKKYQRFTENLLRFSSSPLTLLPTSGSRPESYFVMFVDDERRDQFHRFPGCEGKQRSALRSRWNTIELHQIRSDDDDDDDDEVISLI